MLGQAINFNDIGANVVNAAPDGNWHTVDLSGVVDDNVVGVILYLFFSGLSDAGNNVNYGYVDVSPDNTSQGYARVRNEQVGPSRTSSFNNLSTIWCPLSISRTFDYRAYPVGASNLIIYVAGLCHAVGRAGASRRFNLIPISTADSAFVTTTTKSASWFSVTPVTAPDNAFGFIGRIGYSWTDGASWTGGIYFRYRESSDWASYLQTYQLGNNVEGAARFHGTMFPMAEGSFEYQMPDPGAGAGRVLTGYVIGSYYMVPAPPGDPGYDFQDFESTNSVLLNAAGSTSYAKLTAVGNPGDLAVLGIRTYENNTLASVQIMSIMVRECLTANHQQQEMYTSRVVGQINRGIYEQGIVVVRLDDNSEFEYKKNSAVVTGCYIEQFGVIRKSKN